MALAVATHTAMQVRAQVVHLQKAVDSCLAEQASLAGLLWSSNLDHACCE